MTMISITKQTPMHLKTYFTVPCINLISEDFSSIAKNMVSK